MLAAGWYRQRDALSQSDAGGQSGKQTLSTTLVRDGLAIRRSVIESHGGRLWAISSSEAAHILHKIRERPCGELRQIFHNFHHR